MYGFIYITENHINGMKYIGQKKYFSGWEHYMGSGTLLRKAIKKYGISNFSRSLIEECNNSAELDEREKYWISKYDAVVSKNFYNLIEGGLNSGIAGMTHSDETKLKMSNAAKGKAKSDNMKQLLRTYRLGKPLSEETIEKMRISSPHRRHTEEAKQQIRDRHIGMKASDETREKIRLASTGRKHTEETKIKIGIASKNMSFESREKGLNNLREKWKSSVKPVIQKSKDGSFIREWESATAAMLALGYSGRGGHICDCCKGTRKTFCKYVWEYADKN